MDVRLRETSGNGPLKKPSPAFSEPAELSGTFLCRRQPFRQRAAKVGFTLVVLLVVAAIAACGRVEEPIRIGLAINLSGRGGTAGEYIRDGALLAVDDINNAGGVKGRPLQLLVEDDLNSEEGIFAADEKLIKAGVIAIIGHSYSENTLVAHPFVTSRNTLLFTPYTATSRLTGQDDLFCRTAVDNNLYGIALASLLNERGIGNVSFLMDMSNQSFVEDYIEHTVGRFPGRVTKVRFNSKEEVDWPRIVDELLASAPEAVIMLTEVTMTGIGAQKLLGRGFSGDLIATVWAQTPDLLQYGGKAVEGMTLISFIDPELASPAYQDFSTKMRGRFNKPPTARSARSYEAVQVLAKALELCPVRATALDLKKALLATEFRTLMGPLRFDASCDVSRPIYAIRVRNGAFQNEGEIRVKE
ncbi:ABC transporter substrate-binding protein [Thiovibrio sp. JS02]